MIISCSVHFFLVFCFFHFSFILNSSFCAIECKIKKGLKDFRYDKKSDLSRRGVFFKKRGQWCRKTILKTNLRLEQQAANPHMGCYRLSSFPFLTFFSKIFLDLILEKTKSYNAALALKRGEKHRVLIKFLSEVAGLKINY